MEDNKPKKKKINFAKILVVILIIYLIVCGCLYVYKEPIRHIEISGNDFVSDNTIITSLGLKDYPAFVSVNPKKMEEILEENSMINTAKVNYGFGFTINIEIEENKPLLIQKSSNNIILSDGNTIENDGTITGIPTLLNDPTEKVIKDLTTSLNEVDRGILYTISEIEYSPSYNKENQLIDENRFLLTMIDSNHIYITAKKAKLLNKYLDIAASTYKSGVGTLYLDSGNDSYLFTPNKEVIDDEN